MRRCFSCARYLFRPFIFSKLVECPLCGCLTKSIRTLRRRSPLQQANFASPTTTSSLLRVSGCKNVAASLPSAFCPSEVVPPDVGPAAITSAAVALPAFAAVGVVAVAATSLLSSLAAYVDVARRLYCLVHLTNRAAQWPLEAQAWCSLPAVFSLFVAGAIGGRFDHSIAAVSFLYKVHNASAETLPPKVSSRLHWSSCSSSRNCSCYCYCGHCTWFDVPLHSIRGLHTVLKRPPFLLLSQGDRTGSYSHIGGLGCFPPTGGAVLMLLLS